MGLLTFGCSYYVVPEDQLRKRAAFDFECDESDLRVTELTGNTRGVEGCGQRATYVFADNAWVKDSEGSK